MAHGNENESDRTDLFAVRSILFLPASNPRAIAKAQESQADLVVLDLEDAVKPDDKAVAREAAVEAVADQWRMPVAIRVNGVGTPWFGPDVEAVGRAGAGFAVLPRAESLDSVKRLAEDGGKPVLAMIETARGVLASADIATASAALIAGTNDLRADLRLPLGAGRKSISVSLQHVILAARAAGIPAFDGVFNGLNDESGFVVEASEGRDLGFDGKSLIHPGQIEPCHQAFAPTQAEIAEAEALVAAFGGGAERFNDRMIERMHVETAQRVLKRARR